MEKINFYSDGLKLAGIIRIPKTAKKKVPGIVCCHGYGGFWDFELLMQDIAEKITGAGYATLTFYHRGLGESEGLSGRVIPREQSIDVRNAITYMQTRQEIDPDRIGLYGTSFGGANVVYTAGVDSRPKCVVSTGGIGDCERWLKALRRRWEWVEFLKKIEEDRKNRVLTGSSQYVQVLDILVPPPEMAINNELRDKYFKKFGMKGYTLESADALLDYKPELVADKISPRPLLLIHTSNDVVCPPEESFGIYERAKEPKKLVILEGYNHYDVYKLRNPAVFEKAMSLAIDWYKKYLPAD